MAESQLLTDWRFWSFIVSFTALVLSQLPPVHVLLRKAKLDLEVYSRIFMTHKIGNPNLEMHLIIRNLGGKSLRVKKISTKLFRDNKHIAELPAQTYFPDPKTNNRIVLTSFDLKPDHEWNHRTCFFHYFDRNDEKAYREGEKQLKDEISRLVTLNGDKQQVPEVGESFVTPFFEFFDEKFIWHPGEYRFEIQIETDCEKANVSKQYRFTIFESMTDSFLNHKKGFYSGIGIYWDSPQYTGEWIEIESK